MGGVRSPLPLEGAASAYVSLSSLCSDGLGNGVAIASFEEPEAAHGPFVSVGLSQGVFDEPIGATCCVRCPHSLVFSSNCSLPSFSLPLSSSITSKKVLHPQFKYFQ